MKKQKAFLFIFCAVLLHPNFSFSKELKGEVTLGAGITDLNVDSYKYGEYNGIKEDDSAHIVGDADLSYLKEDYFLDFKVKDLGLDSRELLLNSGRVGSYNIYLNYNEMPHLISNGKTPFAGDGDSVLSLPVGFVRAADTSGMTTLSTDKHSADFEVDRTTSSIAYSKHMRKGLDFSLSFKRTEMDGTQSIGGVVGLVGGTSSSIILPQPIEYQTDDIDASLEYNSEKAAMKLSLFLSTFENSNESLTWDNPFVEPFGTAYPLEGSLSLSPDNQHQGIRFTGVIKELPYRSRITLNAGYSKMEQDEEFLPYTINTSSTVTTDLPRSSADAEINVAHLMLNAVSRPTKKLSIKARYRFYSTYNETSSDEFLKVLNDTGDQATSSSSNALYNLPLDYAKNHFNIDASYRLSNLTRLKVGYAHEIMNRDFNYVKETKENSYKASVNSTLSSYITLAANYSLSSRRMTDDYDGSIVYESYNAVGVYDESSSFDTHPAMRNFDLADKDRDQLGLNISLLPSEKTTVNLIYNDLHDDYVDSSLGLQENEQQSYTIDLATVISKKVSFFTYYTGELTEFKQANLDFDNNASASDLSQSWHALHEGINNTVGIGSKVALNRDLSFDLDYSLAKSDTKIGFTGGSVSSLDLPSIKSQLETFALTGRYKYDKKMTIGLGYQYDNFKGSDWSADDISPASTDISNILTLYSSEPDYEAHLCKIFLTYSL